MIYFVEVDYGESAPFGDGKMKNSYSKHMDEEKESYNTEENNKRKNTGFEQKQKIAMLDKTPANFQLEVSFSQRKS